MQEVKMKRTHDIPKLPSRFWVEVIVISDSRISRLKTSGISPGVPVVQANAGTPISNENVRGRVRRIADGEKIEKERVLPR